jgi:uncharacterized protein YneF (UPF0154 family)
VDIRVEVSLTFLIGIALGYYVTKHYIMTGKAA